jgi:hypothetical protein
VTTYSTLLWTGTATSSQATVYTTPAGYTTVVRDVEVLNGTAAVLSFHLVLHGASGFPDGVFALNSQLAAGAGWQWQGRVVVPAGASIQMPGYGTSVYGCISGYQLSG